jgi:hypothetical protein
MVFSVLWSSARSGGFFILLIGEAGEPGGGRPADAAQPSNLSNNLTLGDIQAAFAQPGGAPAQPSRPKRLFWRVSRLAHKAFGQNNTPVGWKTYSRKRRYYHHGMLVSGMEQKFIVSPDRRGYLGSGGFGGPLYEQDALPKTAQHIQKPESKPAGC